jgi:hypothetical protein
MEYSATFFDSSAMLRAMEMSEATPWRTPLKQFVDIFRKPTGNLQDLLAMFVDFVVKLYRDDYLPESRCKVVTALLDAMWVNVSLRLGLLRLRKVTTQFFGLNLVGQQQFEECFDNWYSSVSDKLVSM